MFLAIPLLWTYLVRFPLAINGTGEVRVRQSVTDTHKEENDKQFHGLWN